MQYAKDFNADRANLVAANAAVSAGVLEAATDYKGQRSLPRDFSIELKQAPSPTNVDRAAAGCSRPSTPCVMSSCTNGDLTISNSLKPTCFSGMRWRNPTHILRTCFPRSTSRPTAACSRRSTMVRPTMAVGGRCSPPLLTSTVLCRRTHIRNPPIPRIPTHSNSISTAAASVRGGFARTPCRRSFD